MGVLPGCFALAPEANCAIAAESVLGVRRKFINVAKEDHIFAHFNYCACAHTVTLGFFWRLISNRPDLDKIMLKLGVPSALVVF